MHRHHHTHSDTELDTHSPKHGFLHSWLLFGAYKQEFYRKKQVNKIPKDLYRDSSVKWLHEKYYKLFLAVVLLTATIDWRITVYFILMPVAYNMINSFHFTWSSHTPWWFGNYRNFNTKDDSQNNKLVSYMIGELHNNHHANPGLYNQAVGKGEFDVSAWIIDKLFIENDVDKQYKW
jgi:stearoyl-CoA desaturase (delta-9 desaturase)